MKKLHIIASPRGADSNTTKLSKHLSSLLGGEETVLDLSTMDLPYVTYGAIGHFYGMNTYESLSAEDKKVVDLSDTFIAQLLSHDTLIISSPMWNFAMPARLKAWIDLIVRVGKTFKMGGAKTGLIENIQKAYVVTSAGGFYAGRPTQSAEHLGTYFKSALPFIGIENVEVFSLEGTNALAPEVLAEHAEKLMEEMKAKIG